MFRFDWQSTIFLILDRCYNYALMFELDQPNSKLLKFDYLYLILVDHCYNYLMIFRFDISIGDSQSTIFLILDRCHNYALMIF